MIEPNDDRVPSPAPPTRESWRSVRWLLPVLALAFAFLAVNALHYEKLPLRIEEAVWPPMAKAIYETGKPVIKPSETHRLRYVEGPDGPQLDPKPFIGAPHPPLYVYTLGASMVVLGANATRGLEVVGLVGLLAAAALLFLLAREATPRWRLIGIVSAALLLVHPYAIQGSLFLDIDTSIYPALALLLVLLAVRFAKTEEALSPLRVLVLGAAIALLLWAKMTTTIPVVGVLVVWWLLNGRRLRFAAAEAAGFLVSGAAIFAGTYALWCWATSIPFSYTFNVTFVQKENRLLSNWLLVDHAANWHLRWFGPALLILALVYCVDLVRSFLSTRRLRPLDLPFLIGVGILVLYILLSPTDGTYQGKYAFPALAMVVLPITWMLLRNVRTVGRPVLYLGAAAIGVAAVLLMPDLLTGLSFQGDYGSLGFDLGIIALAGAAILAAWLLGGKSGFAAGVLIVVAILGIGQAVRSYDARTSAMYPIRDTTDFEEAMREINANAGLEDIVFTPKDLGFYIERKVIEGEDAFTRGDALTATVLRTNPRVTVVAHDSFGPPVGPKTEAVIEECFPDIREFGTATVRYRSPSCG